MLPDFPKEKALLSKFWNSYLENKHRELLGVFSEIPSFAIHEGNRWKIERPDGTGSEQQYEELSSEFIISLKEVPDLTPEKIRAKLDVVAKDSAGQMTGKIFTEMQKASEETGNIFGSKGQSINEEVYLEVFEKIGDFDDNGVWHDPFILVPPNSLETNNNKFAEWHQREDFLTKKEDIMNKKREEWNAREALRKLVD